MQEAIKNWVKNTLDIQSDFAVEYPADLAHGDYAVNVAMVAAKAEGKNPRELGEIYKEKLETNLLPEIEKIEIAGPGFINVFLKKEFFGKTVGEILDKGDEYGKNNTLDGQKVMIEFTDPNPFKLFHIGHMMSNSIGESFARIIEANGAEVKRACYQGDVGLHVAKALWGKMQKTELSWGDAYVYGSQHFDDNKEEIISINKKIYERSVDEINKLYDEGRQTSLDYFEGEYARLGMQTKNGKAFDFYFFESEAGPKGKDLVLEFLEKEVFEKSDGAVVFKGEERDPSLHTRVFINSEGLPVYEAKELALAGMKYEQYPYDTSIVITGNEINDYFRVLMAALQEVNPELQVKTIHRSHGMLRLPSGKMSSRTGDVVTAKGLIDDVKEKIKNRDLDTEIADEIVETIAVAALKYSILKQAPGKDIIFDFEKSLSFEGDSGPYLQYTAVRTKAIKEKAKTEGVSHNVERVESFGVQTVERMLHRFPEVVRRAHTELAPQAITTYLIELASAFNTFYGAEKIIDTNDINSPYKLALTEAVGQVVRNGLYLLGIKVPEKM